MNWTGISHAPEPLPVRAMFRHGVRRYRIALLEHARLAPDLNDDSDPGCYSGWGKRIREWQAGFPTRIDTVMPDGGSFFTPRSDNYENALRCHVDSANYHRARIARAR